MVMTFILIGVLSKNLWEIIQACNEFGVCNKHLFHTALYLHADILDMKCAFSISVLDLFVFYVKIYDLSF